MGIYQAEYCLGGNCIRQNIWIGIIRVEMFQAGITMGANFPGGNCPDGSQPRWEFSGLELS